jgi:hypothetical protein
MRADIGVIAINRLLPNYAEPIFTFITVPNEKPLLTCYDSLTHTFCEYSKNTLDIFYRTRKIDSKERACLF